MAHLLGWVGPLRRGADSDEAATLKCTPGVSGAKAIRYWDSRARGRSDIVSWGGVGASAAGIGWPLEL